MLIIGAPDFPHSYLITDDICRFVREGRFKTVLEDVKRFQVNYVTVREVPTERDLALEMCRFAIASFNYREVRGHRYIQYRSLSGCPDYQVVLIIKLS